ncbi:cadmium resistance transporter [Lactiplantibacillus paraplantarum]|uniref:cadmium resistance transporter n=1 Tax=Lactiplantibacillus paraplantarum TaxID=60520 RepID=UPI0023AA6CA0|nr:cadmium resistance transporter [Lactiplantibacillus paraplantarum]WEE35499.1 cadmium resistance transporter [Lactiplantibacillus paraplantarum]
MHYGILALTFLSVNLDFFLMLVFLLKKYQLRQVLVGYLLGNLILLTASFFVGKTLTLFLPEWVLGVLGVLPIWLAFHDDDDDAPDRSGRSPVINVLVTYLAVCAGCNLSIFLPVLVGESMLHFLMTLGFIGVLTILVVFIINQVAGISAVQRQITAHGEWLMKVCYVVIGLYVFWDSGLISHLLALL